MKIVHVVDPFAGGLATFLKLLTEELPLHTHIIVHGERRELVDPEEVKKIFPKANVKFIYWKSIRRKITPHKDIKAYWELCAILRRFKNADIFHLHSSKAGFIGRMAARNLGLKNVIYTPNGAPFLMPDVGKQKRKLYEFLEKSASKMAGKIVCSSASEQQEYVRRGMKAQYINNGTRIGLHSFSTEKDYNTFRIVTVGRIAEQKHPEWFNMIAIHLSHLKHFEMVWIGDGELKHQLTASNVRVTGWLSEEDLMKELQAADIYLSTSHFEGLPFAVMEAMSLGKCLLLSDCTGNRDLVKNGQNGRLFSSSTEAVNQILYFYLNREMTQTMGLQSIELCKDYFNICETAKAYEDLYYDMSKSPRPVEQASAVFASTPEISIAGS